MTFTFFPMQQQARCPLEYDPGSLPSEEWNVFHKEQWNVFHKEQWNVFHKEQWNVFHKEVIRPALQALSEEVDFLLEAISGAEQAVQTPSSPTPPYEVEQGEVCDAQVRDSSAILASSLFAFAPRGGGVIWQCTQT